MIDRHGVAWQNIPRGVFNERLWADLVNVVSKLQVKREDFGDTNIIASGEDGLLRTLNRFSGTWSQLCGF